MDESDVISAARLELKDVIDLFSDSELEQAVSMASYETGWTLPVTKPFRCYWIVERTKRACISQLCFATAHKFKFKQINLNQRFEHYIQMLKLYDEEFALAKSQNADEFCDAIDDLTAEEKISRFGFYMPTIMSDYTPAGRFPKPHRHRR